MALVRVQLSPLPTTFRGTPQQLAEAIADRLSVLFDGTAFVIGDTEPEGNEGPWLKNGKQWWVWDETTSAYIPQDVSASVTPQIAISEDEPDEDDYQLWLKLDGTEVKGLFYWTGSAWVEKAAELQNASIATAMLKDNSVTSDKIKNGAVTPEKLENDFPLSKIARGAGDRFMRMAADGSSWQAREFIRSSVELTVSGGQPVSVEHNLKDGEQKLVPTYVRAVLVCKEAQGNYAEDDEVDPKQDCWANDEKVGISLPSGLKLRNKTSDSSFDVQFDKWRVKFYFAR